MQAAEGAAVMEGKINEASSRRVQLQGDAWWKHETHGHHLSSKICRTDTNQQV